MKNQNKAIIIVAVIALCFVAALNTDLRRLTSLLDETRLKLVVICLVFVVAIQSIGLWNLAKTQPAPSNHFSPANASIEQRGRGRPKNPCEMARIGLVNCPLSPNTGFPPELIERLSQEVAHHQHAKLTEHIPAEKQSMSEEEKSTKMPEQPSAKATEQTNEKREDVGKLMVDLLRRKGEGEKRRESK